jgi:L-arabinose isomerase
MTPIARGATRSTTDRPLADGFHPSQDRPPARFFLSKFEVQRSKFNVMQLWFLTGSQHLYGPGPLKQVAENSQKIVAGLNASGNLPLPLVFRPVLTTPDEIRAACIEAGSDPECAGLVLWMHTFSPAKMWIGGLSGLRKPFLHLHTQFHRDLPWATIDMDFINLNQAAHGDREAGFLHSRMRLNRKVVVGHWEDPEVQDRIAAWMRATRAWQDLQGARFARFGDNMRQVAVTDGDKVSAEATFGFTVDGYGVGDLVRHTQAASDAGIDALCGEYEARYEVAPELRRGGTRHESLREARADRARPARVPERGRISRGSPPRSRTCTGSAQLPGLAVQRLMADGYGFGAEGDWKTCGAGARDEGDGLRFAGRHVVHGGLHLPSRRPGQSSRAGRAHARNLPVDRGRQTVARRCIRWASAARPIRYAPRVRHPARPRLERFAD